MFNSTTRLILFTRFPEAGTTKTRLIPFLGPEGAATLQKQMTEYAVMQVEQTELPLQICYTGGTEKRMKEWLGEHHTYVPQSKGELGERMSHAFNKAFADGVSKVVVMGTDCPENRSQDILDAVQLLNKTSCVIGPASDGGYYLIGLTQPQPELFRGIDWGTNNVLHQTCSKTKNYKLLSMRTDVDEAKDIPPKISVIIPILNEEEYILPVIQQAMKGFNVEVVMVDGGSADNSVELAHRAGICVISSKLGRALQMNQGAQYASGEIVLFLHVDSYLPDAWDCAIRNVMSRSNISLGYFTFGIKGEFLGRRWVEWGANIRSHLFKRPYGDQGLFLRKGDFFELGLFPEVPILEDMFLVKRARRIGRVCCTKVVLLTSGRRWTSLGVIKTTVINQVVLVAAWFGIDLGELSKAYREGRIPRLKGRSNV